MTRVMPTALVSASRGLRDESCDWQPLTPKIQTALEISACKFVFFVLSNNDNAVSLIEHKAFL